MFDDCNKDITALAQSFHFLPSSKTCHSEETERADALKHCEEAYDVIGVIGSESSKTTISIANLLTPFNIPMVSYLATAPALSNKFKYPDFYRTVPTDSFQARVIMELLRYFDWTSVSVVYRKGAYGDHFFARLAEYATEYDVCFEKIICIDDNWKYKEYKDTVFNIVRNPLARIVIVIAPLKDAKMILQLAKLLREDGRLTWIATESWLKSVNEIHPFQEYALGTLSVDIMSTNVERFDQHFQNIGPHSSKVNPWISDYWMDQFQCRVKSWNPKYKCDENLRFTMSPYYAPEKYVSLVYDAVYSYAFALENIVRFSDCDTEASNREEYLNCLKDHLPLYMRNVSFLGETERMRYHPKFGYTKRHYVIHNLQNTSNGYELVKIGIWNKSSTTLEMDDIDIQWASHYKGEKPTSSCRKPCGTPISIASGQISPSAYQLLSKLFIIMVFIETYLDT